MSYFLNLRQDFIYDFASANFKLLFFCLGTANTLTIAAKYMVSNVLMQSILVSLNIFRSIVNVLLSIER